VPGQNSVRRARSEDIALYAARFEILRLLPRAESTLHYRVRDMASGQERAVSEQEITPGA
jgi:hypothetical protein